MSWAPYSYARRLCAAYPLGNDMEWTPRRTSTARCYPQVAFGLDFSPSFCRYSWMFHIARRGSVGAGDFIFSLNYTDA